MRMILIAMAGSACVAALAWAGPIAPGGRACCDLWIFEPEHGPQSYAVARKDRSAMALVELTPAGARTLEGRPARQVLDSWIAASHRKEANSILIDARQSHIVLGGEDAGEVDMSGVSEPASPEDEIDPSPGDQLILIRNATPAQTRKFIADMPALTAADRARLVSVVPD